MGGAGKYGRETIMGKERDDHNLIAKISKQCPV
jgi:hypothetical protein